MPATLPARPASGRHLRLPTLRQLGVVLAITLQLSWMLSALSGTPYLSVFGRVGFIGALQLCAFVLAGGAPPPETSRWLSPSVARLLAVLLAAPVATATVFAITERWRGVAAMLEPAVASGYVMLALVAAIAAKAENSATLMAILSFPVILPLLLLLLRVAKNAMDGLERSASSDELLTILAIDAVVLALSYLLFPFLWKS